MKRNTSLFQIWVLDICEFWCRNIPMFFFIFDFLAVLIDIFISSMRSGVKFYVDLGGREVERTILDPFRDKIPRRRVGTYKIVHFFLEGPPLFQNIYFHQYWSATIVSGQFTDCNLHEKCMPDRFQAFPKFKESHKHKKT